jgi:hypothetical protein
VSHPKTFACPKPSCRAPRNYGCILDSDLVDGDVETLWRPWIDGNDIAHAERVELCRMFADAELAKHAIPTDVIAAITPYTELELAAAKLEPRPGFGVLPRYYDNRSALCTPFSSVYTPQLEQLATDELIVAELHAACTVEDSRTLREIAGPSRVLRFSRDLVGEVRGGLHSDPQIRVMQARLDPRLLKPIPDDQIKSFTPRPLRFDSDWAIAARARALREAAARYHARDQPDGSPFVVRLVARGAIEQGDPLLVEHDGSVRAIRASHADATSASLINGRGIGIALESANDADVMRAALNKPEDRERVLRYGLFRAPRASGITWITNANVTIDRNGFVRPSGWVPTRPNAIVAVGCVNRVTQLPNTASLTLEQISPDLYEREDGAAVPTVIGAWVEVRIVLPTEPTDVVPGDLTW